VIYEKLETGFLTRYCADYYSAGTGKNDEHSDTTPFLNRTARKYTLLANDIGLDPIRTNPRLKIVPETQAN
jgi:hypothetical protein